MEELQRDFGSRGEEAKASQWERWPTPMWVRPVKTQFSFSQMKEQWREQKLLHRGVAVEEAAQFHTNPLEGSKEYSGGRD